MHRFQYRASSVANQTSDQLESLLFDYSGCCITKLRLAAGRVLRRFESLREYAASRLLLDIHPAASLDFDDKRDTSGRSNRLNYRLPSRHPGRIGVGPRARAPGFTCQRARASRSF